jgi:hypothetical protein
MGLLRYMGLSGVWWLDLALRIAQLNKWPGPDSDRHLTVSKAAALSIELPGLKEPRLIRRGSPPLREIDNDEGRVPFPHASGESCLAPPDSLVSTK